jgi:hypothetical protein
MKPRPSAQRRDEGDSRERVPHPSQAYRGGSAPIPAVRGTDIEPPESTHCSHPPPGRSDEGRTVVAGKLMEAVRVRRDLYSIRLSERVCEDSLRSP